MKNLPALDALRAFALAAEKLNLRLTAEILHISQPPLSRKIKSLERSVGMKLFNRGRRGMELTAAGKELLAIVQPLLSMAENVREKMDALADSDALRVGLTTAFEQCVFASSLGAVRTWSAAPPVLKRAPSIRLAKAVADGELDFAMVALPVPGKDMAVIETGYAEPLLAAMPSSWKITEEFINLTDLNGRPFFWFPAARNPAWHERMGRVFATLGFSPQFIEEPPEYDVALSCVATGEAWLLVPASFAVIRRHSIKYARLSDVPPLELGAVFKDERGETLARKFIASLPSSFGYPRSG